MVMPSMLIRKTLAHDSNAGIANAVIKETDCETAHCEVEVTPVWRPTECYLERHLPLYNVLFSEDARVKDAGAYVILIYYQYEVYCYWEYTVSCRPR